MLIGTITWNLRKTLLVVLPIIGLGTASPACAGTQGGTVSTAIVTPMSLVKVGDLSFGDLGAGTTAGQVTVNASTNARSVIGGVTMMGGTVTAARFLGFGFRGQRVRITRPTVPVTLTRIGGGATMTITTLTLNGGVSRPLNAAGLVDIRVGGTLAVGANQVPGSYIGSFPLTIAYE